MADIDFASIDVGDMLEALHLRNVHQIGDEWNFSCPFPEHRHGDQSPSSYMNDESTAYICHGCKRTGNAISFCAELADVSLLEAEYDLKARYDSGFRPPVESMVAEWDDNFKEGEEEEIMEELKGVDKVPNEKWIEAFEVDWESAGENYLVDERGFDPLTLDDWEVGYDDHTRRFTIPIRDTLGRLVGFKGRSWEEDNHPKYKVLGKSPSNPWANFDFLIYDTKVEILGLDRATSRGMNKVDELIVCEGELNAIKLHEYGYTNAIALGGSGVNDKQMQKLKQWADSVVLFLDSDDAGYKATNKIIDKLELHIKVYVVPDHEDDPARMSRSDVEWCLDNKVQSFMLLTDHMIEDED